MTTIGSPIRLTETSPVTKARISGTLYLLTIILGAIGESIQDRLVVAGDAAATAGNIVAHAGLLRIAFVAYLVEAACGIVTTALCFDLLKPVGRTVSLAAGCFDLTGIGIKTVSRVFCIAPLAMLGGGYVGAVAKIFWLLAFGVNEERWKQRAAASATSI